MRFNAWDIKHLTPDEKLCSYEEMPDVINGDRGLKRHGYPVVLVPGVFDVLHLGHMQFIQGAAKYGMVVVGLENDESVRANKGPTRPIHSLRDRMLAMAAFQEVRLVFGFDDAPLYSDPASFDMYVERYKTINPLFVAVPQWDPNLPTKQRQAYEADVPLAYIPGHFPSSTTQTLQKIGFKE